MTRSACVLAAAYVLDLTVGDPTGLPHPVRLLGRLVTAGERRWNGADSGAGLRGGALAVGLIAGTALAAAATIRLVRALPALPAFVLEVALGATTLATSDLVHEAGAVAAALEADDLPLARARVARIVGRDTADLDASEVARAAVETLAESSCDGIVAPLMWFAVGGVPMALAFKAASTLDSMIGHRDARYERFGFPAARLDDLAGLLPARMTAALTVVLAPVVGGRPGMPGASGGGMHRRTQAPMPVGPSRSSPEDWVFGSAVGTSTTARRPSARSCVRRARDPERATFVARSG